VISPHAYNKKVGLFLVCPITSRRKDYPFEVQIATKTGIEGVVLADQIKSLDWRARQAEFVETASQDIIDEVTGKLLPLIDESI
jgi:mRNA interferase MazF